MTLKVAVIAGEVSGDLLGADLVAALKRQHDGPVDLVGVGGEGLQAQGLKSLFDYSELSIMGFTQVIARLPKLVRRISETASAIVKAKPDVLIIIDSPDFTHRVAKMVRARLPELTIVNYVCPSVWAWKEYRATQMLPYVDHVLAVLPFEPKVMEDLGGPKTTFVGHRLTADPALLETRQRRAKRPGLAPGGERTILLLPGSRSAEVSRLLPVYGEAAELLVSRNGPMRFVLPTVPRQEARVRALTADWKVRPEVVTGAEAKWMAFAEADAAIAASGTVILELGLTGIPVVSTYKTDWLVTFLSKRIKVWSAALPNLIADYAVVPEYINELARPGSLARWIERLSQDTLERRGMLEGFDLVWQRLSTDRPPGERSAEIVLDLLKSRGRSV
ncbi:lipid-A-disaccharide synthase [Ferirhizobium litorale]|uniref:Lipid-A-disaccharide synthase n=1 Tax=Ferirhizobium litorale TaxID=2927786 RepID=A0AAE3QET9_9HYPH|nr:lipid-A-disaccharide synthase [Fererhizobium litorale]MDI7924497.1 lipid-A-disaccharide synthase [Fererhizobium litorale]